MLEGSFRLLKKKGGEGRKERKKASLQGCSCRVELGDFRPGPEESETLCINLTNSH